MRYSMLIKYLLSRVNEWGIDGFICIFSWIPYVFKLAHSRSNSVLLLVWADLRSLILFFLPFLAK